MFTTWVFDRHVRSQLQQQDLPLCCLYTCRPSSRHAAHKLDFSDLGPIKQFISWLLLVSLALLTQLLHRSNLRQARISYSIQRKKSTCPGDITKAAYVSSNPLVLKKRSPVRITKRISGHRI